MWTATATSSIRRQSKLRRPGCADWYAWRSWAGFVQYTQTHGIILTSYQPTYLGIKVQYANISELGRDVLRSVAGTVTQRRVIENGVSQCKPRRGLITGDTGERQAINDLGPCVQCQLRAEDVLDRAIQGVAVLLVENRIKARHGWRRRGRGRGRRMGMRKFGLLWRGNRSGRMGEQILAVQTAPCSKLHAPPRHSSQQEKDVPLRLAFAIGE